MGWFTQITYVLPYLNWYQDMDVVQVFFLKIQFLKCLPPPHCNGRVYCASSIDRLHFKMK